MLRAIIGTTVVVAALSLGGASTYAAGSSAPTYNHDVGPILNNKCASCHRPSQVAPMTLLTFKDVRPWARAIKAKVTAREMPPWFADPRFGKFANDPSLSDDEIATIVKWVDAGAPEGAGPPPAAAQL